MNSLRIFLTAILCLNQSLFSMDGRYKNHRDQHDRQFAASQNQTTKKFLKKQAELGSSLQTKNDQDALEKFLETLRNKNAKTKK